MKCRFRDMKYLRHKIALSRNEIKFAFYVRSTFHIPSGIFHGAVISLAEGEFH